MEDENKNIQPVIKAMAAKLDAMYQAVFDLTALSHRISQEQKRIIAIIAEGKEPFDSVPRGERDTVLCEECGSRVMRGESMKKTRIIDDDVVLFTLCRACFYGRRETSKIRLNG